MTPSRAAAYGDLRNVKQIGSFPNFGSFRTWRAESIYEDLEAQSQNIELTPKLSGRQLMLFSLARKKTQGVAACRGHRPKILSLRPLGLPLPWHAVSRISGPGFCSHFLTQKTGPKGSELSGDGFTLTMSQHVSIGKWIFQNFPKGRSWPC